MKPINETLNQIEQNLDKQVGQLDSNSIKETLTKPSYKCPVYQCDGTGLIFVIKESGETVAIECECSSQKVYLQKLKTAKIPLDFHEVTISSFDSQIYETTNNRKLAQIAKHLAKSYVKDFNVIKSTGKGIYLYSDTKGSGKTHLSISILNELIKKYNVSALYISAVNMLNEIKRTFSEGSEVNSYELINYLGEVDVLLIDDLGVEKVSDWSEEIITQILETRMNFRKVTLITSNIVPENLAKTYKAGRISSRIEKITVQVEMPTESIRSIKAVNENDDIFKKYFSDKSWENTK